ncbi:MAG: MBL fold metallo-hydrolase, partial [Firmicutes bacterium]|nr:MBL fold metallo-hydrolase [Bacillota bacterium]
MKKKILVFLFVFCLCILPLTGCMGHSPTPAKEPDVSDPAPPIEAEGSDTETSAEVPSGETLEVFFLDVDQGDSTLLRQGDKTMLIDTGERDQRDKVLAALGALNIDALDIMVLTHPHTDHMGCAQAILENVEVRDLYMTDFIADTSTFENLLNTIAEQEMTFTVPEPGSKVSLGAAEITFLAPVRSYDDCNDSSIALKVVFGENSFLFTGDAEIPAEMDILASGADVSAQVLHAGHHGSSTSTDPVFFAEVDPEIAVISCGRDNDYGH